MDYNRSRSVWHDHIARWGGGANNGHLLRLDTGVKRVATMAMLEYTPKERGLYADGAVRFWVAALNLWQVEDKWPDFEKDVVEFKRRRYRILIPPAGQQPDGSWIAFDLSCMFYERV